MYLILTMRIAYAIHVFYHSSFSHYHAFPLKQGQQLDGWSFLNKVIGQLLFCVGDRITKSM